MGFADLLDSADDGTPDNQCAPTLNDGTKHPGYALPNDDKWFNARRDWMERRGLVVIDASSSREASPEELRREFGLEGCADETCSRKLQELEIIVETMRQSASALVQG